ncbi:MAG: hypothetical protein SF187_07545 [Deltaproteobacteria bacterium]|nr:hypothetical protein [Deltaproteobacteria bacterium]
MQPKVVHGLSASFLRAVGALCFACAACGGAVNGDVKTSDDDGSGGEGAGGEGGDGGRSSSGGWSGGTSGAAGKGDVPDAGARSDDAKASDGDAAFVDPPPPAGLVPVIVALGPGGRTAVSCNGGRQFRVNDFYKTPDDDHSANAVTGLAGGRGAIIASAGWGAPGRVFYSDNAVDWQELPSSSYTKLNGATGPSTENTSSTFFDGAAFKVFWSHKVWTSEEGRAWKETSFQPTNISHIRNVQFYPKEKLLLMRVERDENGSRNFLMMTSSDLGRTFTVRSPRTTGCAAFEWGPVAQSHGVIVAGGSSGAVCRSQDGGATWTPVANLANLNSMFADQSALFAARGDELLRSEDGITWTRVLKAAGSVGVGAWSKDTGYAVSVSANGQLKFYRSDDGQAWVASAAVSGTNFTPRFMQTAFVKPSPKCPGI